MAGMAIQRLMRSEDGAISAAYIDLATLQPVENLEDYQVIEPMDIQIEDLPYADLPENAVPVTEPGEVPAEAKTLSEIRKFSDEQQQNRSGLQEQDNPFDLKDPKNTESNQFGYTKKPGFVSAIGKVPGTIGMFGKVANLAYNEINREAREKARSYLGLEPEKGFKSTIGALAKDVGPNVAEDVSINERNYDIAQDGMTKSGKLALTPNEARQRAMVMDTKISEDPKNPSVRGPNALGTSPNVTPSQKAPGTLGPQAPTTDTGLKQGIAGTLGGVEASNPGTIADASFPGDEMPDISAPLGVDTPAMDMNTLGLDQKQAGRVGGIAGKSVKTGVASPSAPNIDLGQTEDTPSKANSPDATSPGSFGTTGSAAAGKAVSPSGFQGMGLGAQYTDEQKGTFGLALAGEISPKTMRGLVEKDPEAIAEATSILGTIDNRVNSARNAKKVDPVAATMKPSQYNALMETALPSGVVPADTSRKNYSKYKTTIDQLVDDYTKGVVATPEETQDDTHYANLDVSSPGWGKKLDTKIGPHTFGTPDASFAPSKTTYGTGYGPVSGVGIGAYGPRENGMFAEEAPGPTLGAVSPGLSPSTPARAEAPSDVATEGTGANMAQRGGFAFDSSPKSTPSTPGSGANLGQRAGFSPATPGGPPGIGPTSTFSSDVGVSGVTSGPSKGAVSTDTSAGPTGATGTQASASGPSGTSGAGKSSGSDKGGYGGFGGGYGTSSPGVSSPGGRTGFGGMMGGSSPKGDGSSHDGKSSDGGVGDKGGLY